MLPGFDVCLQHVASGFLFGGLAVNTVSSVYFQIRSSHDISYCLFVAVHHMMLDSGYLANQSGLSTSYHLTYKIEERSFFVITLHI